MFSYTYDAFKRVTGLKIDDDTQDRYTYAYNANGQVAHVTDNRLNRAAQSEYDLSNRPMRVKTHENGSHVYTGEVGYDVFGNLMQFTEKVGTGYNKYSTAFGYDEENRPTTLTYGDASNKLTQTYDAIGRLGTRTLTVGGRAYNKSYTYEAGGYGAASTTPLIKSITQDGKTTTYTYDDAGNILSVDTPFNPVQVEDLTGKLYEDGGKRLYAKDETGLERILYAIEGKGQAQITTSKVDYAYDKLGQLTRVDDPYDLSSGQQGTTTTYSYDLGGNILEKRVFPYTLPSESPIGAVKVTPYVYADTNWKDKLTSYNGMAITYDAIGNPLSDGTWSYDWESGRQLASMTKVGTTVTFAYNVDGLRIRKTVSGAVTDYTLHGKQVVHLKKDGNNLHFFYDIQGRPAIVDFNGVKYAYAHNPQGDIVGLVDGGGNLVVEYTYNAWGKPLTKTGTLATTLGTFNPFRYRGYVFDEETGLYYLRSRYYNPVWERFVNADILVGEAGKILNHNIFSYYGNNPINRADPTGQAWWHWLVAAVVVAVAAVAVVATAGGAAAGIVAVTAVANGMTATTVASTVAASAFVGTSMGLGVATIGALSSSSSLQEFADQGSSALVTTVIGGGIGAINGYSASKPPINKEINRALKTLDKTGLRPGQTQVSASKIMSIASDFDPIKARSSVTNIEGTRYLVEGHHTTIAATILGRGTGPNMGGYTPQPPSATNVYWSKQWYQFWRTSIKVGN